MPTRMAYVVAFCGLIILALGGCSLLGKLAPRFDAQEQLEESPLTVCFDASRSSPAGLIADFHWDFGDGSEARGMTTSHTYARHGRYKVTLTITSNRGDTADLSQEILVKGRPPRGSFLAVVSSDGHTLTAHFACMFFSCYVDCSFHLDFGDGQATELRTFDGGATHVYDGLGPYTVEFTITDLYGRTDSVTKVVSGLPLASDVRVVTEETPTNLTVSQGEVFVVRVLGNATTGYLWERHEGGNPSILRPVGDHYTAHPDCDGRAGCGGYFEFRYEAVGVGHSQVNLVHWRPWMRQPIEKYSWNVEVISATDSSGDE